MTSRFRIFSAILGLATLTVPTRGTAQVTVGTFNGQFSLPFGAEAEPRFQQVYASSAFPGPIDIRSLTFFQTNHSIAYQGDFTPVAYSLYFSTTSAPVNGLSDNLNANVTGPESLFGTYVLPGPANVPVISFLSSSPFMYDPAAGNLLLDIWTSGDVPSGNYGSSYWDADMSGLVGSNAREFPGGSVAHSEALVTEFNMLGATTVPEPSSVLLLASGLIGLLAIVKRTNTA